MTLLLTTTFVFIALTEGPLLAINYISSISENIKYQQRRFKLNNFTTVRKYKNKTILPS